MRLLRITFGIFILFVFALPTKAQPKLPIKLGLKVAPNVCWLNPSTNGYSNDGARAGATIGFVSDFYFAERYAISTGFNFSFLNGKLSYRDERLKPLSDTTILMGQVNRKYNFIYLEIPIMVKMQTKKFGRFSFYGQIGFGTSFRLKVTADEVFTPDSGQAFDQKYNLNEATTLIRESILVGAGTEFHLDQSSRLFLGITYSNSLNNVLKSENYKTGDTEKSMLNFLELSLGILF